MTSYVQGTPGQNGLLGPSGSSVSIYKSFTVLSSNKSIEMDVYQFRRGLMVMMENLELEAPREGRVRKEKKD